MELTRGALKFALYVLAVVIAFVGVENLNHLQTLKTEPLRFEAAAAGQPASHDENELPVVVIESVEITAAAAGSHRVSIVGTTRPNTLVEVIIESKSERLRAIPDAAGSFVVQADVQLSAGPHQVFARTTTPDGLEVVAVSNPAKFTVPTTSAGVNRTELTSGGLVILGVVISLAALVL